MSQAIRDFVKGMGQALDLGATMTPQKTPSSAASQGRAIRSYWRAVGRNLEGAMQTVPKNGEQRKTSN